MKSLILGFATGFLIVMLWNSNFGQYVRRYWTHYVVIAVAKDDKAICDGQWREVKFTIKCGEKQNVVS